MSKQIKPRIWDTRVFITALAVILSGCATPVHIPSWAHPDFAHNPELQRDAATLSTAECYQTARTMITMPSAPNPIPVPAPSSYTTTGTYANYGGFGVLNTTTRPSGSFSAGMASGANLGAAIAHSKAVNDANNHIMAVTSSCMRMRGWIDVSTPEGMQKLNAILAPKRGAFDDLPEKKK